MKALRHRTAPPEFLGEAPSVTIIRPIRGLDVGARENTLALLNLDYPSALELLFVFDTAQDPGYAVVEALVKTACPKGRTARVLLAGHPPPGQTGKLNAMVVG